MMTSRVRRQLHRPPIRLRLFDRIMKGLQRKSWRSWHREVSRLWESIRRISRIMGGPLVR